MQLSPQQFVIEEGLDQHLAVLKELGDCHTALGNFDRARECYGEASLLAPEAPGPHVGLGVIALQTGDLDDAEAAFRQAVGVDEACAEAHGGLAMVLQQRGNYAAAFDRYMVCLDKDADNLVALLGLFQTSCQMGSFEKITHYLNLYLDRHPGDTSVLYCLATLKARDGRYGEAAEALETVLALEPENSDAQALLADVRRKGAAMPQEARSA